MLTIGSGAKTRAVAPPPPPPPPPPPAVPRAQIDNAVRAPALHGGQSSAPPPENYATHTLERGETLGEIATRHQTTVPMLNAANPQLRHGGNDIDVGQQIHIPLGKGYGQLPVREVVEPGQTLTELAAQHQLLPQSVAQANRHEIANPDLIHPGQDLWVPAAQAPTALSSTVQATDQALTAARGAERNLAELPANTNQAIRNELLASRDQTGSKLDAAVQTELNQRVQDSLPLGRRATEADYQAASEAIKARYVASPAETQRLTETLDELAATRKREALDAQAGQIVQDARNAGGDLPTQLKAVQDKLAQATPEVREATLNSTHWHSLQQDAANWATEPLAGGDLDQATRNVKGTTPQSAMLVSTERLEQLTASLDADSSAELLSKAMPNLLTFGRAYQAEYGGSPFGGNGVGNMLKILDRSGNSETAKGNIGSLVRMGMWDEGAIKNHISNGGRADYAVAFAAQPGTDVKRVMGAVYDGMSGLRGKMQDTAEAYSEHVAELGWLVQNHGGSMTPEQLQKAIADYGADKGADWNKQGEALQAKLAEQGAQLQAQISALQALPADSPGRQDAIDATLNDPATQLALTTAWEKKPELLQGAQGNAIMDFFADPTVKGGAKVADTARKLIADLTTQFVKHNVSDALGTFNPNDPASVSRAQTAISTLRNSHMAALLGVSTTEMNDALTALTKAMPAAGDSAEVIAHKMVGLDYSLGNIGNKVTGRLGFDPGDEHRGLKAFDKATRAGQMVRGLGMLLGGVGLLASTGTAMNDNSLKNWLKVAGDGLGLTQKGLELAVGMGKVNEASLLGKAGSSLVGRVLGAGMAVFDVWSAYDSAQQGDYVSAGLYGAGAAGGVTAALFTGPIGWAGLAVVGLSAAGLGIWGSIKESRKHEPEHDGGVSMRFLQQSGLNEAAARALTDQSGDGHSVVPLLNHYAKAQGLKLDEPADQQKFVQWLNSMSADTLALMRDNLHHTIDRLDGDASSLPATDDSDEVMNKMMRDYPVHTRMGNQSVTSVAQLAQQLGVLGIPSLAP